MSELLFKCHFAVPFHGTKKRIKNKLSKARAEKIQSRVNLLKEFLYKKLLIEKIKQRIDTPINCNINLCLKFHFPESIYKSKQIPELISLYELPQAVLEATGVIANGTLVQSNDGSTRLPIASNSCFLTIEIRTATESLNG